MFPLHFITHFIPQIQAKKSKNDNTAFFLISFYCHLLVKQKAGYEKSDQKAAFCLGLSRSLVWDSKIHLILNEEQPCMSAEVEGWSQTIQSQVPPSSRRSAVLTRLLLLLPTQNDKQRGSSIASSGGRENSKGHNKKMTLNRPLRTFNREQHLLEEEH